MIGIKLAASRRADDPLLDPIAALRAEHGVPILHHIWQHRRGDGRARKPPTPSSWDASPRGIRRCASSWRTSAAVATGCTRCMRCATVANVFVDLSGSGVDGGMLEACLAAVGAGRLLWGCDLTIDTGWAKLRYLERILAPAELERVRWRNAAAIFPAGAFPAD